MSSPKLEVLTECLVANIGILLFLSSRSWDFSGRPLHPALTSFFLTEISSQPPLSFLMVSIPTGSR